MEKSTAGTSNAAQTPVFLFNLEKLIPSGRFYDSLSAQLKASKESGQLVCIDCASTDSKTEFFSQIFSQALDSQVLSIPYDFSAFAQAFKSTRLTLMLRNVSQLNPVFLDDLIELWKRGCASGRLSTKPSLALIMDSNAIFLSMDTRLRARFTVSQPEVLVSGNVFEDLLLQMTLKMPFWIQPSMAAQLDEQSRAGTLSLPALLKRLKFLLLINDKTKQSRAGWQGRVLLLFLRQLSKRNFVQFYTALLDASLPHSEALAVLLDELKFMTPHAFMAAFSEALNALKVAAKLLADNKEINKVATQLSNQLSSSVLAPLKKAVEGASSARSSDSLKDAQFDSISALKKEISGVAASFSAQGNLLVDERGSLRKAFDADPSVALQYALKHPQLYLNCSCCGKISDSSELTSETVRTKLSTVNKPCLMDTCLLYRLSMEFASKSVNLVDLFESFCAVLNESSPTPLLR